METFDFFGSKKGENERQEQLHIQLEQQNEEKMLANFDFDSTCHQRYENGRPVWGLQVCPRYIKIRKNTNGCSEYQLTNGDGYILTATNGDTGQPQFAPKPMRVVKITDTEILLRGYIVSAQTPFGWQEIDLSDYGFAIALDRGVVQKCILYMYDRNIYVEYIKMPHSEILLEIASQCNMAHNIGNYNAAEKLCSMLYNCVSPRRLGGKSLVSLSADYGQCVGFAFVHMAMCYDWGDEDINSVASENAYYCLAKNLIKSHNTFVAPAIFTLMQKGSKLIKDELIASWCDMVQKQIGMPIYWVLGGNPYTDSELEDFRRQAIDFKDNITYYVLTKFYDVEKKQYTIPTDLPYYIPNEIEINSFLIRMRANLAFNDNNFLKDCEEHFMSVYKQCEETLLKY